ncbi:MAG: DUF1501 domain-containing protein [Burkholderiales bacterium]
MNLTSPQRRMLLKWAAGTGLLAAVERNLALAQTAEDYKALVCIFLQGGNDGENTLVRYDSAGYANYASIRPGASGINLPQGQLLPIQPLRGGPPYGFHPACAPLQSLFNAKKLAVIANVGVLVQPSTKLGLESQGAPRPNNLFSHTDQELLTHSAVHTGVERSGWGGRMADRLDPANPGTIFPPMTSAAGLSTFVSGRSSVPLTVPEFPYFKLHGSGPAYFQFDTLRDATIQAMLAQSRVNVYDVVAQLYAQEGLAASSVVFPILQNNSAIVSQYFGSQNTSVGRQLRNVVKLIEGRGQTKMKRQVFYVQQGSYDTHANELAVQGQLLGELSSGIDAFGKAMDALGLAGNVTVFTLSEFGRTFKPAANLGTDHGWGNYAFVMGDAVKGGDFYGSVPTQALNGPDDLGSAGRWIPTTSLEQYAATLCRWFGIAEGDLPYVFPNIGAFPNTNLGFMT